LVEEGRYRGQIIKKEGYIREAFKGHHDCVFWGSFLFLRGYLKNLVSKDNKKDFGTVNHCASCGHWFVRNDRYV
jgi:hypothetical protein